MARLFCFITSLVHACLKKFRISELSVPTYYAGFRSASSPSYYITNSNNCILSPRVIFSHWSTQIKNVETKVTCKGKYSLYLFSECLTGGIFIYFSQSRCISSQAGDKNFSKVFGQACTKLVIKQNCLDLKP